MRTHVPGGSVRLVALLAMFWLHGCAEPLTFHDTCDDVTGCCPDGRSMCDGTCVDLQVNHDHCGTCQAACTQDESCVQGSCQAAMECGVGMVDCGGACVDLATSSAHCGACGSACPVAPNTASECEAGTCTVRCLEGWSDNTVEPGCESVCAPAGGEVCNGVDDDCDGLIDEDFPCQAGHLTSCTTACGKAGTGTCTPACTPPQGAACEAMEDCEDVNSGCSGPEVCDGVDNDCNGVVDDGFSCPAAATESRPCACGEGVQLRTCSGTCAWGGWSSCSVPDVYPVSPLTGAPVCPPAGGYVNPAVFFAPHADDETIAMAGAIKEHLDAGRPTFVELLTHGQASNARARLNNGETCPWHTGTHTWPLTEEAFGDARIAEFLDAMATLGVDGVYVSDFGDGNLTSAEVWTRIAFWQRFEPGVSLKGIAGTIDPPIHSDHAALWDALMICAGCDVRGYSVQLYDTGTGLANFSPRSLSPTQMAAKQSAVDRYQVWAPEQGRFAIAFHSVPVMMENARSRPTEYLKVVSP